MRCMALGQMLISCFEIIFVCLEIPDYTAEELSKLSFQLVRIDKEEDFFSMLKGDEVLVLDHYGLGSSYEKSLKSKGNKLVRIDDLHEDIFYADLIINHAPGISPLVYKAQNYTQFALGLDYVLLRSVFLNAARNDSAGKEMATAFICFGGADHKNITQIAVDILKEDLRFKRVIVVTGTAYPYLHALKESVGDEQRFSLYHSVDQETMLSLMLAADLSIVPASGILQEVLAVGSRVISGMYIENQKNIFANYRALNAFESAGDFSKENIMRAVSSSFLHKDKAVKKFIDGKSGERLLKLFLHLSQEDLVSLRSANENDLEETLKWANDKAVRAFSFNNTEISPAEHYNWFLNKINSQDCYYFIASKNNENIGSVRFDIINGEAVISYLLASSFHHQGLGTILLKKGLEALAGKDDNRITAIVGYVMPENIPSVKTFERLGYQKELEGVNFKFKKTMTR